MYIPRFVLTRRHAALATLALGIMAAAWLFLDSKWEAYKFARRQERQIAWFQGSDFTTLTPWEHYDWAMRLLLPRDSNTRLVAEPTIDDLKNAIRHLEAIPPDSDVFLRGAEVLPPPVYVRATELLPFLRLRRDQPRDYLALEEARYRSCIVRIKAKRTEVLEQVARERPCRHVLTSDGRCVTAFCDTGFDEECAPLATSERLAQLRALVPFR